MEKLVDASGDGKIVIYQYGNFRIIHIVGFTVTVSGMSTYNIGTANPSSKGAYIPVIISGVGAGFAYINTSAYIGVYSADMTKFVTGTIYGTGIYHI